MQGENAVKRWIELGEFLIAKYNDGCVKDENGRPRGIGYPSEWLETVLESNPQQFKLPVWSESKKNERLQ